MNYILQRDPPKSDCTFGVWKDLDGNVLFQTLEPPTPQPAGTRQVKLRWSPEHGYGVPGFLNVPGHTNIEFHPGNIPKDTKDCVLPGSSRGPVEIKGVTYPDAVLNSRATFVKFMNQLGFDDYALDANGKITTALNTEEAVNVFIAANPGVGDFTITILNATSIAA